MSTKNSEILEISNLRIVNASDIGELVDESGLCLYHSNIRSIAKNFNELQVLLQQLQVNFDIIALTENGT